MNLIFLTLLVKINIILSIFYKIVRNFVLKAFEKCISFQLILADSLNTKLYFQQWEKRFRQEIQRTTSCKENFKIRVDQTQLLTLIELSKVTPQAQAVHSVQKIPSKG